MNFSITLQAGFFALVSFLRGPLFLSYFQTTSAFLSSIYSPVDRLLILTVPVSRQCNPQIEKALGGRANHRSVNGGIAALSQVHAYCPFSRAHPDPPSWFYLGESDTSSCVSQPPWASVSFSVAFITSLQLGENNICPSLVSVEKMLTMSTTLCNISFLLLPPQLFYISVLGNGLVPTEPI